MIKTIISTVLRRSYLIRPRPISRCASFLQYQRPNSYPPLSVYAKTFCDWSSSIMAENKYIVGYAKLGTSSCKKCKQKIDKGGLRIGKVTTNPFSDDGGDMKHWFHPPCMFETFQKARATTKKIEEPDDLEGFADIQQEDKDSLNKIIKEFWSNKNMKKTPGKKVEASPSKKADTVQPMLPFSPSKATAKPTARDSDEETASTSATGETEKDNSFREFRRLCAEIAEVSAYTGKTKIVADFLTKGSSKSKAGFKGDTYLWTKLLLPTAMKRVYNLNNKQLVKVFSQIFGTSHQSMVEDLEQGDVAETIRIFFQKTKILLPQNKSTLSIQEVDRMLDKLSEVTKEDDQQRILTKIAKKCTSNDLKMVVRLIKHDLRINAGAKHILDGLDPNAYAAFQASRNLKDVVDRVLANQKESENSGTPGMRKALSVRASLMTPVLPMLAEACRSVDHAMKKCPNGFYAEIKYDGERVQVHKQGDKFQYFSRSLKPVLPHKVSHFKDYIPTAFPSGDDLILDAEVLLIDTKTDKILPFGSLGVHKKAQFQDANVCLFVFDCLHINGKNLMDKPIKTRRKILSENMTEVPHRILFSEIKHITVTDDLQDLLDRVFREGLEGLVLKDVNSLYEPGKRHWLKVKKDYLHEGSMADSADLVVLGAFYGTGNKGGMMSVFLLGCYDTSQDKWCTVTKCGGIDDKTLDNLQKDLDMVKISKDFTKVPDWLNVNKPLTPDFVVADPKKAPVWEISGAEFSQSESHTAGGISIRFPRVSKFREDKGWKDATDLERLKLLFKKSKEVSDVAGPSEKKGKSPAKKARGSDDDEGIDVSNGEDSSNGEMSNGATVSPKKETSESRKTGLKRPASDDEDVSPSPSKKSKPMCKYGAGCYQKKPAHLAQYDHPVEDKKFPDIFRGAKIFLQPDIEDYRKLKRYIVAFDGDLVEEFDKSSATHIIVGKDLKGEASSEKRVCVTKEWLLECIKKKSLVPTGPYKVD